VSIRLRFAEALNTPHRPTRLNRILLSILPLIPTTG